MKPKSDDKEQAVDKEGSDTESAEDSNSATKVTANGGSAIEQNGNTPKVSCRGKSGGVRVRDKDGNSIALKKGPK